MKKLILASGSPRRKELLEKLNIPFEVQISSFKEDISLDMPPNELVVKMSYGKAKDISGRNPESIVIAADTIVYLDEKVLGKPKDPYEAKQVLTNLSGKSHSVFTGYTIIDNTTNKIVSDCVETQVFFKPLSDQEISDYVKTGEPLDKAGSYAIQGLGARLIDKIQGDYNNVIGLPLDSLSKSLKEFELITPTISSINPTYNNSYNDQPYKPVTQDNKTKGVNPVTSFERPNTIKRSSSSNNQNSDKFQNNDFNNMVIPAYKKDNTPSLSKNIYDSPDNTIAPKFTDDIQTSPQSKQIYFPPSETNPSTQVEKDSKKSLIEDRINSKYDDFKTIKNHPNHASKNIISKFRRIKEPSEIERKRQARRQKRLKQTESNITKAHYSDNSSGKDKSNKSGSKKQGNGLFSGLLDFIHRIFNQDILVKFILAAIAGVIAFWLIFDWMGFLG